ncbi:hypothetical protein CPY51_24230 [Rhizobium tubonense]|uniref:EamA domain-containing protein n=1 Tax=Rhizobium tubonense TaxID=484088 RepID=A0A2W4EFF3_9HYPH|nr:hypothetical protein [Rhizobium tubonense]PZM09970.1 hypothetical protein CPY51_24230 [Rhizobium tubonense]
MTALGAFSQGFAALTVAKVGDDNVNSEFATFFRTTVLLMAAGLMLYRELAGAVIRFAARLAFPLPVRPCHRRIVDLLHLTEQ